MQVVFCGDNNIAKPVAVVLASISNVCEEKKDLKITIVGINWSQQEINFVKAAAPTIEVEFVSANHIKLPIVRKGRHVTAAAYLTLYLPELLPDSKKILYLDHDVLIRDDRFFSLWDIPLDNKLLAAVPTIGVPFIGSKKGIPNWRDLGLDPQARMFNSGIVLFDLERCRKENLTKRAVQYAESEGHNTRLADQQTLNVVLNGNWKSLPLIFNAAMKVLNDNSGVFSLWKKEDVEIARDNPCIVHFLGGSKPWHLKCKTKFTSEWRDVASLLGWYPWKEKQSIGTRFNIFFKNNLRNIYKKISK